MSEELLDALDAAETAGKKILEIYGGDDIGTSKKDDDSPVTKADTLAQTHIFNRLSYYGYGFIGEESGESEAVGDKGRAWVVDPIDGTKDFIHETDDFSVMIGLVENGVPLAGVVHLPAHGTTYYAEAGKGAYKKERDGTTRTLTCSSVSALSEARMPVSRFHLHKDTERFLEISGIKKTIPVGSAGIKLALIAEGVADLYLIERGKSSIWDICAADIILHEAGGRLTDVDENRLVYTVDTIENARGVIAANSTLFPSVLEAARNFRSTMVC